MHHCHTLSTLWNIIVKKRDTVSDKCGLFSVCVLTSTSSNWQALMTLGILYVRRRKLTRSVNKQSQCISGQVLRKLDIHLRQLGYNTSGCNFRNKTCIQTSPHVRHLDSLSSGERCVAQGSLAALSSLRAMEHATETSCMAGWITGWLADFIFSALYIVIIEI